MRLDVVLVLEDVVALLGVGLRHFFPVVGRKEGRGNECLPWRLVGVVLLGLPFLHFESSCLDGMQLGTWCDVGRTNVGKRRSCSEVQEGGSASQKAEHSLSIEQHSGGISVKTANLLRQMRAVYLRLDVKRYAGSVVDIKVVLKDQDEDEDVWN